MRDGLAGIPEEPVEIGPFAWMEGALLADLLDEHEFVYRATATSDTLSGITTGSMGLSEPAAYDIQQPNPVIISPLVDSGLAIRIAIEAAQHDDVIALARKHKSALEQQVQQRTQSFYNSAAGQHPKRLKRYVWALIIFYVTLMIIGLVMTISQL